MDATGTIHIGTGSVNNSGNGGNSYGVWRMFGQTCPNSTSDGVVPILTPNPGNSSSYANVTVVAYPLVANYVGTLGGKYGLVRSMFSSSTGLFSFQFSSMDSLDAMLENGPWFIRNNLLILRKWHPDVNLMKEDVGTIPVWVKLYGVPVTAFNEDGLSAIATKLGTHLMLDSYTSDMYMQSWGRSSYAKAMIEMRADVELKDNIVVAMPKITGEGYYTCNIRVGYEWKLPREEEDFVEVSEGIFTKNDDSEYDPYDYDMYESQEILEKLQAFCDNLDIRVRRHMPEDPKTPLILGRPFLSTAQANIDVFKRKITLRVGNDKLVVKSNNPTNHIVMKVYAFGLKERMELDLEARLIGEALFLNRSRDPEFGDYIDLNDLNEPLELRNHENEDLGPAINEGEVIDELNGEIVETMNDNVIVEKIDEYPSLCDYDRKIKYNWKCVLMQDDPIDYLASRFCQLWEDLHSRVDGHKLLIAELNMFGGPLPMQCAEFLK
ncbi:putative reverse transcriptase domain-containing protein [Tanacetum coccineum]